MCRVYKALFLILYHLWSFMVDLLVCIMNEKQKNIAVGWITGITVGNGIIAIVKVASITFISANVFMFLSTVMFILFSDSSILFKIKCCYLGAESKNDLNW